MEDLEGQVSAEFLREALGDFKELFLTPLTCKPGATGSVASEPVRYSRHSSNLRTNKEVIVLKNENDEKNELKDLTKFVTSLTQGYLAKIERILLTIEDNERLCAALSQFDATVCSIEALCSFEYRIERQGEH